MEKKVSWRRAMEMWRWAENYCTHFGWAPWRSPTPAATMWTRDPKQSCTGSLALPQFIFLYVKQLTQFILYFLSLQRLLRGIVTNKLHIKQTNRWCFVCCHLIFYYIKVTMGAQQKLKGECYTHRPFRTVVVHVIMWCHRAKKLDAMLVHVHTLNIIERTY